MTLTTHAVVGAATAQLVSVNPVIGFFAGFLTHFVLDAVPHGHYQLRSHTYHPENVLKDDIILDRRFLFDVLKLGFDLFLGVALAILFFHAFGSPQFIVILAGALGGLAPDALQFAYFKIRKEPLVLLQRFHMWIHARKRLDDRLGWAALIEGATIVLAVFVVKALLLF